MTGSFHPSRRSVLAAALLGSAAALASAATPAFAAANYTVIPKLPGEFKRSDTVYSRYGNKPYEVIDVKVGDDAARLFVPHSAAPSLTIGRVFYWYYHANGSSYTALSSAFKYTADKAVDQGVISICPNNGGGAAWTSQPAITAHKNAVAWVQQQWKIGTSFLRSNSGGGALLCWAYANKLVPNIRGAYMASGVYDTEDIVQRDSTRILPAYNNDATAVPATNPKRLPQSVWAGARIRISGSTEDTLVPMAAHGTLLYNTALPVAKEAAIYYHSANGATGGHTVPSETNQDMLDTFQRWLTESDAPVSTVPGAGTYQNGAAQIVTVGTWSTLSSSSDSGGSISASNTTGASASLKFSGTGVSWISRTTSASGTNEVYIDGALVTTVDRYSATTKYKQTVFTSAALPAGEHTITIKRGSTRNAASSGSNIILDAFVVTNTPAPTTPTQPTAPGAGTYQNGAAQIVTVGTWSTLSSTADSGGSISGSTTTGASASLTFSGKGVSWVSRKTSASGINEVYIDGALVATVDRYSATAKYKQTVFTSGALAAGTHTIMIKRGSSRNAASSGSNIILDAFIVT